MKKLSFMLALAVLTFGFIATTTSCHNSLTGIDPLPVPARAEHADGPSARQTGQTLSGLKPRSATSVKCINVYFNVKNGGWGLSKSEGKVITKDGSYYGDNEENFAGNFSVSLAIPSEETYVLVFWQGKEFLKGRTYLSARLNLIPGVSDYEILVNYNGRGKVVTEGLTEVSVWK